MKLIYIYHSGYVIETNSFAILIDYYKDTQSYTGFVHDILLPSEKRLYILCSHSHLDHFRPEILSWRKQKADIRYIFSQDILEEGKASKTDAVYLNKSDSYTDESLTITAFGSTDLGISFLIETEHKKLFHAGDLNNWHWNEESSREESQTYEDNYLTELEELAQTTPTLDVAMFPVDPRLGKDYMRGAEQFINRIKVDLFAPMHFGDNFSAASAFQPFAEKSGSRFANWKERGQSVEF
jgi:hypothetical protein